MQRYADATRMAPYLLDALLPRIRAGSWVDWVGYAPVNNSGLQQGTSTIYCGV